MKSATTILLIVFCTPLLSLRAADLIDPAKVRILKDTWSANSLAFTADGKRLFAGGSKTIGVWEVDEGTKTRTLKGHEQNVSALAVSKDGKRLISGSWDAERDETAPSVKIWDLDNKADMPENIVTGDKMVISVAISPNEKYFATGGREKKLRIWDFPSGKLRVKVDAHPRDVQCVAFSPDSKILASCGYDSHTKLWDAETGKDIGTIPNIGVQYHWDALAFSPDGKFLAMCGSGLRVLTQEGKEVFNIRPDKVQTSSMSYSPDGKLIATGGMDKQLKIYDAMTGKELAALAGHRDRLLFVRFSPDGRYIATGASNDVEIRLWPLVVPAMPKAD